jgi:EPS-associated MarR family transcriptional regulator
MGSSDTSSNVQDEVHLRVLRLLGERPDTSQRELADQLGVSLGKANYCLRALVEKGFLKIDNFRRSSNKLSYAYLLTPSGIEAKARLARSFLARKQSEYEALRAEILALEEEVGTAGR